MVPNGEVTERISVEPRANADSTERIQRALDSLASQGGEVALQAGVYRLDGGLTVPTGVILCGSWQSPHHSKGLRGTILCAYGGRDDPRGPPLIQLEPSSAVRGLTVVYPEQTLSDVRPYPPTIRGRGVHCSIMDVTLVNPYFAIDLTQPHQLHYVRNVFGSPLHRGISVDACADIGRVENIHFNPHYWFDSGLSSQPRMEELIEYLWNNCEAFVIARSDWEYHLNTFSYGCKVGYRFTSSSHGACNGNFLGIAADWAKTALLVEETQRPGLLITNGEWVGGRGSEAIMRTTESFEGVVQLANNSFWGPAQRVAVIEGSGVVSFSQCNFSESGRDDDGNPTLEARGGSIIVQGCTFWRDKRCVVLTHGLASAVILGNVFRGTIGIENKSDGRVEIASNVSMGRSVGR